MLYFIHSCQLLSLSYIKLCCNNMSNPKSVSPLSNVTSTTNFFLHILKLARGAQFYWFLTLLSTIYFSAACIIKSLIFGTGSATTISSYKNALASVLITYIIVLKQTYRNQPIMYAFSHNIYQIIHFFISDKSKKDSNTGAGTRVSTHKSISKARFLKDDNLQYLLFTVFHWLFATPYFGTVNSSVLYPFAIYAFFHLIKYFQINLLPYLPTVSPQNKQIWSNNIGFFYKTFNERSMALASNTEVLLITFYVMPFIKLFFRIALGRLWREQYGGFAQLRYDFKLVVLFIVTVTFLRARYENSNFTKAQVMNYDAQINQLVWLPFIPHPIRQVLVGLRKVVGDFLELVSFV